ncbi:hypothetical protein F2Q69_00035908 [Brassica cretica]|uniref:Uncharacterized protein n=1 Tax=Brassica cretica TaxID=69181 RepID=A0A8S9SQT9_BRACR|nr:hypothetical protein F2Q69_00035908 [Brassica cretica]
MLLSWVLSKDEALLKLVGLGGHCRDLVSSLEQNLADVKQKLLLKLLTESERNIIASYETDDEMMRKHVPLKFFCPQPQGRELSSSHQRRNNKWTRQSHSLSIGLVKVSALSPAKAETFGLMWTSSVWSCLRANFTGRFQKLHRRIETEAAPQILYEQRDETTSSLRIFGSLVGTSKAKLSC